MTTLAKEFCEALAKVANDYEATVKVDAEYKGKYKVVKFKKHNDKRGLRFIDGSKLFFGDKEGTFILPNN